MESNWTLGGMLPYSEALNGELQVWFGAFQDQAAVSLGTPRDRLHLTPAQACALAESLLAAATTAEHWHREAAGEPAASPTSSGRSATPLRY